MKYNRKSWCSRRTHFKIVQQLWLDHSLPCINTVCIKKSNKTHKPHFHYTYDIQIPSNKIQSAPQYNRLLHFLCIHYTEWTHFHYMRVSCVLVIAAESPVWLSFQTAVLIKASLPDTWEANVGGEEILMWFRTRCSQVNYQPTNWLNAHIFPPCAVSSLLGMKKL